MLRPERQGDEAAIGAVTAAAFEGHPHSDGSEPKIIERLRAAGVLTLSLVAEQQGEVVGHVAFSPVTFSGGEPRWFALGPISVRPDRQGQGIGSRLVREGLRRLGNGGARGCVLVGEPAYYRRFGFSTEHDLSTPGIPREYLLALPLNGPVPSGIVAFHPGFFGDAA
ncbi:putative acetyltransferase [Ciceribacter lividus]|uniref:Putative acetyltransferase n=2 Tax=Ciceribacter lividus TaxID=1197950 RepID=A0A6I7HNU5_9HYPH|nr:putative acetyltransferase [Ciceribacter lividus]